MAKLPEGIVKLGHEEALHTNGLCRARAIRKLTDDKLGPLGICNFAAFGPSPATSARE